MNNWRARASVLLIFILGVFCGAAAVYLYMLHVERQVLQAPDTVAQLVLLKLDHDLDLSDLQKEQIHEILRRTRAEILRNSETALPELMEAFEHGRLDIRKVLTPEQQARFDEITAARKEKLLRDIQEYSRP